MRIAYRGPRTLDSLVAFYSDVTGKPFVKYYGVLLVLYLVCIELDKELLLGYLLSWSI